MSWQGCSPDHGCGSVVQGGDVLAALDYVNTTLLGRHPVAAVNISLVVGSLHSSRAECDGPRRAPERHRRPRSNNVAVVAGAGNDAQNPETLGQIGTPACITGAISVGATDDYDDVAPYSNTGTFLDFFAPAARRLHPA